ncbi:MAG: acyltransferase [Pyrinomonadaceae bacterium]
MVTTLKQRLSGIFEMPDTASRNLPMEGLRGFAVLLVFFVHYDALFKFLVDPASTSHAISAFLWSIGHSGVDLFFVLSGYLIYGSITKKARPYSTFMRRRIERIYPTFLAVFAVYLAMSLLFPGKSKLPAETGAAVWYVIQNILLLPGLFNIEPIITVAWSLSYEFFYYLLIPILVGVAAMRRWAPSWRVVFFLALAAAFTAACIAGWISHIRLIMFISGILLFEAKHSFGWGRERSRRVEVLVVITTVLTFPLIYGLWSRPGIFTFWPTDLRTGEIARIVVLFFSFFAFTLVSFNPSSLLGRMFTWTPIRWLGNMSYSYYLIHGLTLNGLSIVAVAKLGGRGHSPLLFWVGMPLTFVVTLISSAVLFWLVERRFSLVPHAVPVEKKTAREVIPVRIAEAEQA